MLFLFKIIAYFLFGEQAKEDLDDGRVKLTVVLLRRLTPIIVSLMFGLLKKE